MIGTRGKLHEKVPTAIEMKLHFFDKKNFPNFSASATGATYVRPPEAAKVFMVQDYNISKGRRNRFIFAKIVDGES